MVLNRQLLVTNSNNEVSIHVFGTEIWCRFLIILLQFLRKILKFIITFNMINVGIRSKGFAFVVIQIGARLGMTLVEIALKEHVMSPSTNYMVSNTEKKFNISKKL